MSDVEYARQKLRQLLEAVRRHLECDALLLRAEAAELERVAQELPRG